MSTDHLLSLLASDWFVAHADALGLLPTLDQDDIEMVSVSARTPVQLLMAEADSFYGVSFEPARIEGSVADFLARCRQDVRGHEAVAALVARYQALDRVDFYRMNAFDAVTRVEGNEHYLSSAARQWRDRLDALVWAKTPDFTSWDESIDLFHDGGMGDSFLMNYVGAEVRPWRLLEFVVAEGGLAVEDWSTLEVGAAKLGIPERVARNLERVTRKLRDL